MQEVIYDDVVIGAFPLVMNNLLSAIGDSQNSLDDLLNLVIQALEVIWPTFLQPQNIGMTLYP